MRRLGHWLTCRLYRCCGRCGRGPSVYVYHPGWAAAPDTTTLSPLSPHRIPPPAHAHTSTYQHCAAGIRHHPVSWCARQQRSALQASSCATCVSLPRRPQTPQTCGTDMFQLCDVPHWSALSLCMALYHTGVHCNHCSALQAESVGIKPKMGSFGRMRAFVYTPTRTMPATGPCPVYCGINSCTRLLIHTAPRHLTATDSRRSTRIQPVREPYICRHACIALPPSQQHTT
jgi:hypothetical protein